ncbi:AraC family transcriptional regulator [Aureibacter tunicatorum]|uniref:AraC family transcriptional regulator n=1 Tax=Aureibacter tunicatorum TaxID=866807 RepID=A0AAE3XNX5_9BACT|nr:AraC family transcriptional regulator [Aureibacter tunicatorum]MDR6238564.1 AraC family transcriptional regulator [Aureibacter tunicatorum]
MQEQVKNDYYERIEKAVNFMEDNLMKKLTIEMISEKASFSKFHFIRVFTAMTGETAGSYLRRRRISRSSKQLINTNHSILNIAFDYQFESQEAYTRSFKKVYNTSPGKYRKLNNNQRAFGRARLTVERLSHLKSNVTMKPKIIEIEKRNFIGMNVLTSLANNKIPQLWRDFMPRKKEIENNINTGCYEIHPFDTGFKMENFTEDMKFEKWAAVEVNEIKNIPKELNSLTIEGGKYAVFEHKGTMSNIQMSFDYAYGTWLSNSEYEIDRRASFERYGEQYFGPEHPESITELWIPIK